MTSEINKFIQRSGYAANILHGNNGTSYKTICILHNEDRSESGCNLPILYLLHSVMQRWLSITVINKFIQSDKLWQLPDYFDMNLVLIQCKFTLIQVLKAFLGYDTH